MSGVAVRHEQPFSFTVLRYVHDVVAGEFLNVGIVMYSPTDGRLRMRTMKSTKRLSRAFPDIDTQAFQKTMEGIEGGFSFLARVPRNSPPKRRDLNARRFALNVLPEEDGSLQWSSVGGGLTGDTHKTFDYLYKRFVSQYDNAKEP